MFFFFLSDVTSRQRNEGGGRMQENGRVPSVVRAAICFFQKKKEIYCCLNIDR
jgi:hypothetical protein